MFGLFKKDEKKALDSSYAKKLEEATKAQRNGDIRKYSQLTDEANAILAKLEALENR